MNSLSRIAPNEAGQIPDLSRYGFALDHTGLTAIGEPTMPQWKACGRWLAKWHRGLAARQTMAQFAIGDWLAYGAHCWGDKYQPAALETGLDEGTLKNFAYVAKRIPSSFRNDNLTFSHHMVVASRRDLQERAAWLKKAEEEKLTVEELRGQIHFDHKHEPTYEPIDGLPKNAPKPPHNFSEDDDHVYPDFGSRMRGLLNECQDALAHIGRIAAGVEEIDLLLIMQISADMEQRIIALFEEMK